VSFPQVTTSIGTSDVSTTTSHTVNLPASASGRLLLGFFSHDYALGETVTWPSGWTALGGDSLGGSQLAVWMEVRYKIATGSEGSTMTITTTSSSLAASHVFDITGHAASTSAPEGLFTDGQNTANPDPPSLDPAGWGAEDTLWFVCAGHAAGNTTMSSAPTNYTNSTADLTTLAGQALFTARRELNAASEDPGTFTLSAAGSVVPGTVAVRPGSEGLAVAFSGFGIPIF